MRSFLSPAYQLRFLLLCLLLPLSLTLDLPIFTGSHTPIVSFSDIEVRNIKIPGSCSKEKWKKKFDQDDETGQIELECGLRPWMTAVFEPNESAQSDRTNKLFDNTKNCKYLVTCNGATADNSPICDANDYGMYDRPAGLKPDKPHNRMSLVDPHCEIGTKNEHHGIYNLAHRWKIEDFATKYNKIIANNPSDKTREDLYIRVPVSYPGEVPYQKEANILAHAFFNVKKEDALGGWTHTPCGDGCHYGQIIGIDFQSNDQPLIDIFVKDTCNWVSVCTEYESKKCKANSMIHIMIKNGFVVFMGNRRTQSTLLMHRKATVGKGEVPIHIQLAGTVSELLTADLKSKSLRNIWAVTSMYRERAVGETTGLGKMLLIFDKEDCLYKDYGVRSKANIDVYLPPDTTKQETIKNENVGLTQYNGAKDAKAQKEAVTEDIKPMTLATTPPPSAAPETTTIAFTLDPSMMGGSTIATNAGAEKVDEQGHLLWAVFYGWISGSFLAILLITAIMYFCRRTFFASWYRGMYKRYQCDASGTTGGVTGVGFGTDQTTGSTMQTIQTMDGTSQMGTTGGETSTMGGTTGGEESTMGTTGGGGVSSGSLQAKSGATSNEVTAKSNRSELTAKSQKE